MKEKTEKNLKDAFAGESQAHMKYLIFAEKAEREGKPNVARLFRAISYAELVHAMNHFKVLGLVKGTSENAQAAIDGETYEVENMYPSFLENAQDEDEKAAQNTIIWALEAEKIHSEMYKTAKSAVDNGRDADIGDVYICEVCGHTVEGKAPDVCLVCGVSKDKFKKF